MASIWFVFISIFVAELGDKTQLATLLFSTDQQVNKLHVFLAASSALVLSSFLAVLIGSQLYNWINPRILRIISGLGFIMIGSFILFKALRPMG
ncbi:MAG: TMEM165/GDT1 family protein [Deltaproteobacteria bacterium]|nr:TMEM165/GDT1 family protein [Deltaproteobacteria bacterium]